MQGPCTQKTILTGNLTFESVDEVLKWKLLPLWLNCYGAAYYALKLSYFWPWKNIDVKTMDYYIIRLKLVKALNSVE